MWVFRSLNYVPLIRRFSPVLTSFCKRKHWNRTVTQTIWNKAEKNQLHKKISTARSSDGSLRDIKEVLQEISLKESSKLNDWEKDYLRHFMIFHCSGYLKLDSKFLVINNEKILALADTYSEKNINVKYVKEIKSFLEQEKMERGKLLPYINDFTLLPDTHLDEVDEFINSHLSTMAKVILSIRERDGNFVLREAECIFRWESWNYLAWVLRDVRDNKGKWKIPRNTSWVSDTHNLYVSRTVLSDFLRILMVANKLEFEDTVYVLEKNLQAKLVRETRDKKLNKLAKVKIDDLYDWNLNILVKTQVSKDSKLKSELGKEGKKLTKKIKN